MVTEDEFYERIFDLEEKIRELEEENEELKFSIRCLEEEKERIIEDRNENYKRIGEYEMYGLSRNDFI